MGCQRGGHDSLSIVDKNNLIKINENRSLSRKILLLDLESIQGEKITAS